MSYYLLESRDSMYWNVGSPGYVIWLSINNDFLRIGNLLLVKLLIIEHAAGEGVGRNLSKSTEDS